MEYASPFVQLLGIAGSALAGVFCLIASCLLLRERKAGPWLMLIGSIGALIGTVLPQSVYAVENFIARYGSHLHEDDTYFTVRTLMYYTFWDWLATASWLVFATGLILFALARKGQARRIAELESILTATSSPSEIRDPHSAIDH